MRRFLDTLLIAATVLFAAMPAKAQGTFEFTKTLHNFGDILESDGKQTCTFPYMNNSDQPVVIHDVITSCGCTVPKWDKRPIKPGENGEIKVTFSNDQGPYPFDKTITVYLSDRKHPVNLRIKGNVHQKPQSLNDRFPIRISGIGFRKEVYDIGNIPQGGLKSDDIEIANTRSKPMRVVIGDCTPGISASVYPNPIPSKKTATLSYTIDTKATRGQQWGNTQFNISLSTEGNKAEDVRIDSFINDSFDDMTRAEMNDAALPYFDKSSYDFGTITVSDGIRCTFKMENKGKHDLVIHKIELNDPNLKVDITAPLKVKAGDRISFTATVDKPKQGMDVLYIISIISNSPLRPNVNLFLTGDVKKK
jgi:plastocyanin